MVKNTPAKCKRYKRHGFDPWARKIPWRRTWQPSSVFLPRESHIQKSLVGYSSWGHKESDTTELCIDQKAQPRSFSSFSNYVSSYFDEFNSFLLKIPAGVSVPAPHPQLMLLSKDSCRV